MSSRHAFLESNQLAVPLNCPKCGQQGLAIVERASSQTGSGWEYVLVSLPDGFYQRLAKPRLDRIETVCHACDGVLPTLLCDAEAPVFANVPVQS